MTRPVTLFFCIAVLVSCSQTSGSFLAPVNVSSGAPASGAYAPDNAPIASSLGALNHQPCYAPVKGNAERASDALCDTSSCRSRLEASAVRLQQLLDPSSAFLSSSVSPAKRDDALVSCSFGRAPRPRGSPTPWRKPSPSPSPSPSPTADPSPTPTPGGTYTYNGCGWPSGDYYNENVLGDSVDPYSSTMIANAPTGNFNDDTSSLERINLASKSTQGYTVETVSGGHNPPMSNGSGTQVPWVNGFFIEPSSDRHSVSLDTQTCVDSEMVQTTWNAPSGPIAAYDGFNMNLNESLQSQHSLQEDNVTASGLPMFGAIDWGEDSALVPGPNHVVQMLIYGPTGETGGKDLSQYGYVAPGNRGSDTPDTGCGGQACTHPLHYGDVLRLSPSYACSPSWSQAAQGLCWELKNYGMIISDAAGENGIRFGLSANGADPWDPFSSVMAPFLANVTLSNFDVMDEAQILCESGHVYGKDCF